VGRLYADLGNCQEALVWLFRAKASGTEISEAEISGLEKTPAENGVQNFTFFIGRKFCP
jgi:hypothetical protein